MPLNTYKNNPDYPDRYTRNKEWKKIIPIQGRPVQAAELTEIQSILQDNIKQGFDTLFKNGSVIQGLRVSVVSRTFDSIVISISNGQLYIEGIIVNVSGGTLTIPTSNIYNILVIINESVITEKEDNTLRDPIKGGFVLGTPGAARLVWNSSLGFSNTETIIDNSYAIAQIVDGVLIQKELNAFYEIEKIMSQFIYERSGNFCVSGLETTSIGLDKRSSSNITKYNTLKSAVDNAEEQKQSSLSNLVSYQGLINSLTNQVQEAQIQASINPTAQNNAILNSLQNQLSTAQSEFSRYSNELANSQKLLESASASLNNSESLLTDQQILSIAPGIAYVEGYRVSLNSPTRLFVPQALPTTSVEAATFTYRGLVSQNLRNFSLGLGNTTNQTSQQYVSLEIDFKNLEVNPNINPILPTTNFNIKVFYKINDPVSLSTVIETIQKSLTGPTLVNNNITYTLHDNTQSNSPRIINDANGDPLTNTTIKEILNKYLSTTSPTSNSLLFSATNYTLEATGIVIDIKSKIYLKTNNSLVNNLSNILIEIPSQTLSEPVSNSTYQLGFRPVQKINRLTANLSTITTITRSGDNINSTGDSIDLLNEDSVVSITQVSQTVAGITTVFSSANYYATQSGIGWRPTATSIPALGTAYQVNFVYTEPLIEGTDFRLNVQTDTIEFIGRTPAINNTFNVDYSYSLSKAGIITLDKDGIISYILSAPSKNPIVPALPSNKLGISSFLLNPSSIEIKQLDCKRQTVGDLYNLAEKIKQNTLNNQVLKTDILALNNALAEGNNPIGVYTDPIINLDKIDLKKTTAAIIPGVQGFMCGYNRKESATNYTTISSTVTIVNNNLGTPSYAILPFTEVKFFSQPRSTKKREITAISKSINKRSRLYSNYKYVFLTDQSEEMYDGTTILKASTKISPCDPITKSGNFFTATNNTSELVKDIITNVRNILGPFASSIIESFTSRLPLTISNTQNSSDFVAKAFNDYKIRPIQIDLHAEDLPPNVKGFKVFVDGQKWYNYTLVNTSSSMGTGTLVDAQDGFTVNSNGTVDLILTLPTELAAGTHTIEIKKDGAGYCKTNIYFYSTLINQLVLTPLKAWNALPITTNTADVSPLIPVDCLSEDLNLLGIDPTLNVEVIDNTVSYLQTTEKAFPSKYTTLTQTFVPNEDYFITKIALKVGDAPVGNNNLNVFLVDTNQQIPIKQIRGACKTPLGYNLTTLSLNNPGTYTNFVFETPQYIKRNIKYGIGLESYLSPTTTSNFSIYSAIADDIDIATGSIIGEQLFIDGQLFNSIDGSSLSSESKEDLTMELYRAQFASSGEINLGLFTTVGGINSFCYNTLDVIPLGTEINYYYKITNASVWIPFKPNSIVCLSVDAAGIEVKAELLSNFKNLTPQLLLKGCSMTMYNTQSNSSVVSNQVIYPEVYTQITIIIDYIKPADTDIEVYYSPNDGFIFQNAEWIPLTLDPNSTIVIDPLLQIYRSTYKLTENSIYHVNQDERVKFRYRLDLTSSNTGISPLVKNIQTYVQ